MSSSPTKDDTAKMSSSPTKDATAKMSSSPTKDATAKMSSSPTKDATAIMSSSPTKDATAKMSSSPTKDDTVKMSSSPTKDDTAKMSSSPTKDATAKMSSSPTKDATAKMSSSPAKDATAKMSSSPTKDATAKMSSSPTKDATAKMSSSPAKDATAKMSSSPTKDADYNEFMKYRLTEDQLVHNNYVRPHPDDANKFILNGDEVENQLISEHRCFRCKMHFKMWPNGETILKPYARQCIYHPKKFDKAKKSYPCCGKTSKDASGCRTLNFHVHNDNIHCGYFYDAPLYYDPYPVLFETTRKWDSRERLNVVGLDCEMVFTTGGFEVAKVTLVDRQQNTLLDEYVRPYNAVLDYNTEYSGITEDKISINNPETKCLRDIRTLLRDHIHDQTIVVGHSLECDLKALRIIHSLIVDTAVTFINAGQKPKLKDLSEQFLGEKIQTGPGGHCSQEDAIAPMKVMLKHIQLSRNQAVTRQEALIRQGVVTRQEALIRQEVVTRQGVVTR